MKIGNVFQKLGYIDGKNIRRDPLLLWVMGIPIGMMLAIQFGVPLLTPLLQHHFRFDLEPFYPFIMGGFVLMVPGIVGMIIGFLLLDERDERTLLALQVTPLPLSSYLFYRTGIPTAIGLLVTITCYPLAGLTPISFSALVIVVALGSLTAPQIALFLAAFAENKVAGFSMMKLLNLLLLLPLLALFLPEPWQWGVGIFPTYWPLKVFWLAIAHEHFLFPLLCGFAINIGAILWLLQYFTQRLYQGWS